MRLVLCLAGAGVVGFFFGPIIGLVTAVLGVGAMMITHLHYLLRLSTWLDDSGQSRLPDGWGGLDRCLCAPVPHAPRR